MNLKKAEFYSEQMTVESSDGQWFVVSRDGQVRISEGYISNRVANVVLKAFAQQRVIMIDILEKAKITSFANDEIEKAFGCSPRAQFLRRLFERFIISGVLCEADVLLDDTRYN